MRKWLFFAPIAWPSLACLACLACGHASNLEIGDATTALRPTAAPLKDPLVQFARLVQQAPNDEREYGVEPGGGVRALASGVRLVNLPNGAVMSADEAFPSPPKPVVPIPDRMGGGFLYLLGSTMVWRSDSWLGHARPLFSSNEPLDKITVGLDRVYLESKKGSEQAIDPRTGAVLDLGAWPPTPNVAAYAAMDGWRAVAVADLRGVVATFDAGASWHPLPIPIDAAEIKPFGGGVVVSGVDASHAAASYEVRLDGQVARLAPITNAPPPSSALAPDLTAKPFGDRPLVAAVEDGWPLSDGTVVVARDGALARVRLEDGVVVEQASNAYPLRPSRCHAIAFGDGVGFVCGEPRGRSAIYRYDAGKMVEARHFDSPRLILPSGTGAIAVRGGCDTTADALDAREQTYCVFPKAAAAAIDGSGAREVHLRGNVDQERVAVLSSGKLAVISPPHGDLAAARITVVDLDGRTHTSAIAFSAETPRETLRVLKSGLWLDGVEERRPGVLGLWSEQSKSVVGFEVDLDGRATAGAFVRDAGDPIVSGRFALGWSASHRGYETTDGGLTWKQLNALPETLPLCPISAPRCVPRSQNERSCGPIGCVTQGWLRIGWGARPPAATEKPREGPVTNYPAPKPIALTCEPTGPAPVLAPLIAPPLPTASAANQILMQPGTGSMGGMFGPSPNQMNQSQWRFRNDHAVTTLDWTPFFSASAPTLRADDVGYSLDASYSMASLGSLMRFYAWGARGNEWEHTSRWVVRWLSPFSSASEVHSTQTSSPPQVVLDSSRFANPFAPPHPVQSWTMVPGDDPQHALLLAKRASPPDTVVLALEADHPPVEIRRADDEPFESVDGAIRMRGRWFLLGDSETFTSSGITIWEADGATAHEFVSIPRAYESSDRDHSPPAILAARSDGRAIGILVDGQPLAARPNTPIRWALSIDADDATIGALEPLGDEDFADRSNISICSGDEAGWVFDMAWPATTTSAITATIHGMTRPLRTPYARVRATGSSMCIERLAGQYDAPPEWLARPRSNLPHIETQSIDVAAISAHLRYGLRCTHTR
ncbi:MAG: hypothetical protein ABI183_17555 [Polyangiaceae bacterium]